MKLPKVKAPVPIDEKERINELLEYKVLGSAPEEIFDNITFLAAQICETPVALISFLATERCFFKSRYNTDGEPAERDVAFCSYVVAYNKTMIVQDAAKDLRFEENPGVISGDIRFYAGAPLTTKTGRVLGSLCVIDKKPNNLSLRQKATLENLARHVILCLELRRSSMLLDEANDLKNLFYANAEAERQTSLMKSQFLANMSHEIRTPIHGVVGCLELMRATPLSKEQEQLLGIMEESVNGIARLTNDVLDLAKIETEQLTLEPIEFDPNKVFRTIQKKYQMVATQRNLDFTVTVPSSMPNRVVGDVVRFDEVIGNLVNNAFKFTEHGSVSVVVADQSSKNNELVLFIQITDTGVGIPSEKLSKLFKPFSQIDDSHKRKHGGSGLSLSITKFLVEKMNGTIGVKSDYGKGSQFWVIVPFAVRERHATQLNRGQMTALIVEDNEINRKVLCKQISKDFDYIQCVDNGLLAVEACKQSEFTVIFMDCQMPIMDGYEATTQIRRFNQWTPIIAISANNIKTDVDRCFQVGMTAYLSKPVKRTDILKCVKSCLNREC
ncbi:hypothetical protein K493DRAFT_380738 [Basidiobolus meristosporus CBS 931.73]|uniref:Histidine kinase n=1 Tax=Basidiobolus meristosporus CBS 931.73 TaxID=1314790 RepID=A0A1Y1XXI5_9FUNG|nr:hypothetical protein K493DRAFT_380738 [Basidiobolus meristosporus CBS 931.73]|eukprot:ORX90457.1 hypothetical protein K493DRAFT_380738 [Basidiobolus meristosporus CBS 931.73]